MKSLVLKELSLQQGKFHLGPLSLELQAGKLALLKGPNGSGKTSLLKSIQGRLRPKAGSILGRPDKIGCVGIEPVLMGSWTVRQNREWVEGLSEKFCNDQDLVKLNDVMDQRLDHLSLGWQRRVELQLLFSLQLNLYLLDEALSPLDTESRQTFLNKIGELKRGGSSFLVTSHREDDFSDLADEVLKLS